MLETAVSQIWNLVWPWVCCQACQRTSCSCASDTQTSPTMMIKWGRCWQPPLIQSRRL